MGGRDDAIFVDHLQLGIAAGSSGVGVAATGGFFARRAGAAAGATATGDAAGDGGDDVVSTGVSQRVAGAGGAADGRHATERALIYGRALIWLTDLSRPRRRRRTG